MRASPGGPLTGLRVLDLGTVLAGPFAATLLADFGAEVIKVEIPGRGDTLRQLGPVREGTSLWFAADARNKKSVTLDLRRPDGRALLLRLVTVSDALVENFPAGALGLRRSSEAEAAGERQQQEQASAASARHSGRLGRTS